MILCRVSGSVVATHKNQHLASNRLLTIQPIDLTGSDIGKSMVALDVTDAGEGDTVLAIREGGSARIIFDDPDIPLQAVVVAIVDNIEVAVDDEEWPKTQPRRQN